MAVAHRTYARALFDAARDKNRLDIVREELEDIVRALDDVDELDALLENPEIESHVKAGVLDQVLGGADDLVRNFIRLLVEKGRAGELREIAADFETLVAEDARILDVE
ncbi:MAG: ATP synthase F1 subunit delta, partial [Polyangiaceae bacterium]